MKKIKMKTIYANGKRTASAGDVIEVVDDEYKLLIKGRFGEPVIPEITDMSELNSKEFIDLIEICDDAETLEMYRKYEEALDDTPRKTVLKAIDKQLEDIKGK